MKMCSVTVTVIIADGSTTRPLVVEQCEVATAHAKARYWNSKGIPCVLFEVVED